jgi:hypothetical protein
MTDRTKVFSASGNTKAAMMEALATAVDLAADSLEAVYTYLDGAVGLRWEMSHGDKGENSFNYVLQLYRGDKLLGWISVEAVEDNGKRRIQVLDHHADPGVVRARMNAAESTAVSKSN